MRKLAIMAAVILVLGACGDEKQDRGLELMPDMFHTPAVKSQDAGTIEVDARDAQGNPMRRTVHYPGLLTPPPGTVARGHVPYPFAAGDWEGARGNPNPVAPTPEVLRAGQHDYLSFCAPCHGRDGDAANAHLARHFSGVPSLNGEAVLAYTDGELAHIITKGKGRMPALDAQVTPDRRWAVAHFLRLQARAVLADQDLARQLPALDAELAKRPDDQALRDRRAALVALAEQAKADLAAIAGVRDGHRYAPRPDPVPEYVGPEWPRPEGAK